MWSSKAAAVIALAALMAPVVPVDAKQIGCASHHEGLPLAGATLYDGPPEELADLMPDRSVGHGMKAVSTWDVANVYRNGRSIYLACRYATTPEPAVRIIEAVSRCTYRAGRPARLTCR